MLRLNSSTLQKTARSGHKQHGVDIYGPDDIGRLVGIKRTLVNFTVHYSSFCARQHRQEVIGTELPLDLYASAATRGWAGSRSDLLFLWHALNVREG